MGLRSENSNAKRPLGSIKLEKFLYVLEAELLKKVMKDGDMPTPMNATLKDFFMDLQKNE
eukprot:8023218-Ditylum_brightwellii.AAC.1